MHSFIIPSLVAMCLLAACSSSPNEPTRALNPPQPSAPTALTDTTPKTESTEPEPTTAAVEETADVPASDSASEYATRYVVVADTSLHYYPLRARMTAIQKATRLPIDTLGREYDARKNLIKVPENDEDEMYAGEYYPRREPTASLSIEYTTLYRSASAKSMALVTGIYEDPSRADSALTALHSVVPKAFLIKTRLYIGCMH
ncbi:hypothetical protein FY528_02110 [Hymenobacter lutimineralis]|uniref:SPOR domain-containing protein n=1 Tax=Hymenobacter lutimineralis TaxID=2606448 RepID=A0A5D6VHF5_9BACT|nr:hypothetical protein [Hymenobacter lutimineralis]TYZ14542.1 hypothetical protein FY528_02110 [Hymenobacter lutimineralis]